MPPTKKTPKKTSKKPTPKPSASVPPPPSVAEQKAAEAVARAIISKFAPNQASLVATMRSAIRKRLPTAHEIVYEYRSWFVISYSPTQHGHEGVLAIRGDSDGIKFYFNQGKSLPDPEKLLKGSATVRSIDIESPSTLTRPAVANLVEAAINHNKVPFPSAGQGPVLLLSASTKAAGKAGGKTKTKSGTQKARK